MGVRSDFDSEWPARGPRHILLHALWYDAADGCVARCAGDVVCTQPFCIVAWGGVLGGQRLAERSLAGTTTLANCSLVLGTVHMCHHPRTHQQWRVHLALRYALSDYSSDRVEYSSMSHNINNKNFAHALNCYY